MFAARCDDFSGFTFVVLLAHKSDVDQTIKDFVAMCQNKFGRKPKVIRSDRGGEYTSNENKRFLRSHGIQMQLTAADCPQQNGKAERKNRTLMEMARCMLNDAGLPYSFLGRGNCNGEFHPESCDNQNDKHDTVRTMERYQQLSNIRF